MKQLPLNVSKKLEVVKTTLTGPSGQRHLTPLGYWVHDGLTPVYRGQRPSRSYFLSKSPSHQFSQKHQKAVLRVEDVWPS
jgi:hypothetical protein